MKSVFITGASRGLGKGFVDYFLGQKDWLVFAGTRNIQNTNNFPNLIPIEIDVSSDESIIKAFELVKSKTDKLDLLINNAGISKDTFGKDKRLVNNLADLDRDSLMMMFDVNSVSPMIVTKTFLPLLSSDPSWIVNISSCRASYHDEFENTVANYGYRASKAALNMMTHSSLLDLPENIKTFSVHPGDVKTDMNEEGDDDSLNQARKIFEITQNWEEEFNGKFMRYDGTVYPL